MARAVERQVAAYQANSCFNKSSSNSNFKKISRMYQLKGMGEKVVKYDPMVVMDDLFAKS
jgi:hypothetical protein